MRARPTPRRSTCRRAAAPCSGLLLGLLGLLAFGPAAPVFAKEKLVNANFRPRTDKHGFTFTLDTHGRMQTQFGYLYSGFTINPGGWSVQKRLMKPDGSEYVLEGPSGQLQIQRRFKVDRKRGGVRVAEIVTNPTGNAINTTMIIYTQHSWRSTQLVTDLGRNVNGPLTKGEGGIVCRMQGPMQGLVLYQLAGPRSKLKPMVVNQNNQNMQFHYAIQVPARGKITILHGAVVLRQATMPTAKSIPKLFRELRNRRWAADLPPDVRRSVINTKGGSSFGEDGSIPSIETALEVEPGTSDRLAISEETLLQGTATCRSLQVDCGHGKAEVPFQRVAAIVGGRSTGREQAVYLRDGQRLRGTIVAEGLRFEMTSGMGIDLDIPRLDRLVMRDPKLAAAKASGLGEDEGPPRLPKDAEPYYLFETFSGDRLRAQRESDSFRVATHWGEMDVPVAELKRMHLAQGQDPGYWIELDDGSRFRAFVRGAEISMKSDLFGSIRFKPSEVRRIIAVRPARPGDDDGGDVERAHLVLAGGDLIVGHIDLDALHFLSPSGVVPQPPSQVKVLHNEMEQALPKLGEVMRFRADIWGGGHVTGELRELVVPFRTARGLLKVPVRDILEVHVPTPVVPQVLQARLRRLIEDLGHILWERREAASAALIDLGALAKLTLEQSLRETKDPEVERRIRRILDKL